MATVSPTQQRWTERLARYQHAQQTVAEFCAAEGISEANFYHWKRKLAGANAVPATMIPIQLTPAPTVAHLELVLLSGAVLRFPPTSTPQQVAALIHALEAEPC
jgi:transposase